MASYEQRKDGVASGRARIPAAPSPFVRGGVGAANPECSPDRVFARPDVDVWVGRGFQPRRPCGDGAPGVRSRPDVAFAR